MTQADYAALTATLLSWALVLIVVYVTLKWMNPASATPAPNGTREKPMERGDFFRCIQTLEDSNVNVSAGELDKIGDACLLQVGPPGHYTCAYLNDSQVRNLVAALQAFLKTALIILLCVAGTNGQPLPDTPAAKPAARFHEFNRRLYFTEIGLLASSQTADAITTRLALNRGAVETNSSVYGTRPSPARQGVINAGFFVAQAAIVYATEHNRHPWIRWTGRAWLGATIANHANLAACNSGVNVHGPSNYCYSAAPIF
jgi:hypothetical protein